jgi:hypothetical protein
MQTRTRTKLQSVQGIASIYTRSLNSLAKLDVSELTGICYLTADTDQALHELNIQTQIQGGCLYISDMFRSWTVQDKAYRDWKAGKRSAYAAPPGQSFHMSGRAIDIDIQHFGFASPRQHWLERFWSIAIPIGWYPIVSKPDSRLTESWHFQFLGQDWRHLVKKMPDGQIAKCSILDAGQWNPKDPHLSELFLQAQCNRLSTDSVLTMDGIIGPKTKSIVATILGHSWTGIDPAIDQLILLSY